MHSFDEEHTIGHGLGRLAEDSDEDEEIGLRKMNGGYSGIPIPSKSEEH